MSTKYSCSTSLCYIVLALLSWMPPMGTAQSCPDILTSICSGANQVRRYLVDELQSSALSLTITCGGLGATLEGWSMSPNGALSGVLLDTSSAGYTRNGNTLTLTNLNSSSEGLYECVYTGGGRTSELCIFVYGRAVFTSCPQEINGCSGSPVSLSVTAGRSAPFNATVVHTAGGSCGFLQGIRNIRLVKTDDRFGVPDTSILSCSTDRVTCSEGRVSLDRGRDPGYEFIFTLSNVTPSDAGMYEVIMEVTHPATGSTTLLTKTFNLEVLPVTTEALPSTTTSIPLTGNPGTRTSQRPAAATTTVSVVDPGRNRGGNGIDGSTTTAVVVVVVLVTLASIVLLGVVILIAVVYIKRRRIDKEEGEIRSERIPVQEQSRVAADYSAPAVSQEDGRQLNGRLDASDGTSGPLGGGGGVSRNGTVLEVCLERPLMAVRRDKFLTTRESCIEPDANLPDLLQSTHRHLNSEHELVTICEDHANSHECSNV